MADQTDNTDNTNSGLGNSLGLSAGLLAAIMAKSGQSGGLMGTPPGEFNQTGPMTSEGQYLWNALQGEMGKTGGGFNINFGGTKIPVMDPMKAHLLNKMQGVSTGGGRITQGYQPGSQGLFGNLAQMLPFLLNNNKSGGGLTDWLKGLFGGSNPQVTTESAKDSSWDDAFGGDNLMNNMGNTGADVTDTVPDDTEMLSSLFG